MRRVPRGRVTHGDDMEETVGGGGVESTHCSSSHEKDRVTGRTVKGEKVSENHRRSVWSHSLLDCLLVPGGTRPSRSRPWFLSLPCSTAGSRSRWCRPLPAQCGTAGSGRSGPCSWETLPGITEPAWGKISLAKNHQLPGHSPFITAGESRPSCPGTTGRVHNPTQRDKQPLTLPDHCQSASCACRWTKPRRHSDNMELHAGRFTGRVKLTTGPAVPGTVLI